MTDLTLFQFQNVFVQFDFIWRNEDDAQAFSRRSCCSPTAVHIVLQVWQQMFSPLVTRNNIWQTNIRHIWSAKPMTTATAQNKSHSTYMYIKIFQNNSSWIIFKVPKTVHITPHLQILPWLTVNAKIQYKECSLCFKVINFSGTQVSTPRLLTIYTSLRLHCSSADNTLFFCWQSYDL